MNANLIQFLRNVRSSYWFLPSAMTFGAIALSVLTLTIDESYSGPWAADSTWWYAARSAGARAMLSTIAGSMIGIAGVTFSMTLVSVSFAASNFGPRLIGNFMRDRGNQVVLGTFIATFVYSLLILRRVRAAGDDLSSFVPQLSVLVALVLALMSVSVLIYFIHHVPETINVSRLTASIGRTLTREVANVFPSAMGEPGPELGSRSSGFDRANTESLRSPTNGYLQALNEDRLLEVASNHDIVVSLHLRPGEFAVEGDMLISACPRERWGEELAGELRGCFAFGSERTPAQDVLFLADQLVEILGRALSPGVNDPYTAIDCIHWMQSALSSSAARDAPAPERYDESGALRVIAPPLTFEGLVRRLCSRSIPYVAPDRNASLAFFEMLGAVGCRAKSKERREEVRALARQLASACEDVLPSELHRSEVREALERTEERLTSAVEAEIHTRDSEQGSESR